MASSISEVLLLKENRDIIKLPCREIREIRAKDDALIVYIDETWAFEGMGPTFTWHDPETENNPMARKKKGLTAGPTVPPTKGRRVIILHAVSKFGIVPGAGEVIRSDTTAEDGDYHRYSPPPNYPHNPPYLSSE